MQAKSYKLAITTQGPTYPPSEILNEKGDFVVIGRLNMENDQKTLYQQWGAAVVSKDSPLPPFGENVPYKIIKHFNCEKLAKEEDYVLYTLPLPLPCNNYPMIFAPEQNVSSKPRPSYPLHEALIPDLRPSDGRKQLQPIRLSDWIKAEGELGVSLTPCGRNAKFEFSFKKMIPNSLYTVMALRELDLNPKFGPTRPGPLGVPNVFITDSEGKANYTAIMPNPFPVSEDLSRRNRIINVVVLWMSTQMSYGGAIGHFGLGGDIHAQLKLTELSFSEFTTF